MNYDKTILGLLDRIKVLEGQVAALMDKKQKSSPSVKKQAQATFALTLTNAKCVLKIRTNPFLFWSPEIFIKKCN